MQRKPSFWRNLGIIGVLHVATVVGLIRWSGGAQKPRNTNPEILWIDAAPADGDLAPATPPVTNPAPVVVVPPEPPGPEPEQEPEVEEPLASAVTNDLPLPMLAKSPEPASPAPAKERSTPKASPKQPPKKTPRKKPAPNSSPKPSATTLAKKKPRPEAKKISVHPAADKHERAESDRAASQGKSAAAPSGEATSSGAGSAGTGSGPGGASQFGWYGSMLHDRFFREWAQPTSVVATGAKMSALVRIRIEKDGRIAD
ncbi:MAG: hypothetical protein LC627_03425, partial [Verrucomicrobiaceae bacterium]|nr:hypothetical protein [Verrucomicrobiaceae bacterium]